MFFFLGWRFSEGEIYSYKVINEVRGDMLGVGRVGRFREDYEGN